MSGMNCTVQDIVRLCRQLAKSEANTASEMSDLYERHFCLGMASAYKHVAEHIESRKLCMSNATGEGRGIPRTLDPIVGNSGGDE